MPNQDMSCSGYLMPQIVSSDPIPYQINTQINNKNKGWFLFDLVGN